MSILSEENKYLPASKTNASKKKSASAIKMAQYLENKSAERSIGIENKLERRENAFNRAVQGMNMGIRPTRQKLFRESSRFMEETKFNLFKEAMFDIFFEALVLDDDFKYKYHGNFKKLVEDTIDAMFESGDLSYSVIMKESSEAAKEILQICEETAKEVAKPIEDEDAKGKELLTEEDDEEENADDGDDPESGESVSEEELDDLETQTNTDGGIPTEKRTVKKVITDGQIRLFDDKKEITSRNVADVVREKVVNVIKSEEDLASQEEELMADIEAQASESAKLVKIPNKTPNHSLFKSIMVSISNKNLNEMKENLQEGQELSLNMDMVFAETIAYYTLLESLNTMKLLNKDPFQIRQFAKELVMESKK